MRDEYESNFVIGKLHVFSQYKLNLGEDKEDRSFEDRISDFIHKSKQYAEKTRKGEEKATWVIGDDGKTSFEGETIYYGKLGKLKGDKIGSFYDEKNRTFKDEHLEKPIAQSRSVFFIHPKSQTIIFEEKKPNIKIKKFIQIFEEMFFDYFIDNIAKLKITLIDDEKYILDLFKDKKIIRMSFDLTPSNPEDRETFRRLDEMLKKSGIDRGKMSFENKEAGLKLEEGGIAKEAVSLSNAGYGNYTARIREKDDKISVVRSKDKFVRKSVPMTKTRQGLVKELWIRFKEYIEGEKK